MRRERLVQALRPRAERIAPVVDAVVEAVVHREFGGGALEDPGALDDAKEVMRARVDGMPAHLSVAMVVASVVLDRLAAAVAGRPFHALPVERRARLWGALRAAPPPFRDVADFYEKMTVFAYCAALEERRPARFRPAAG